MDPRTAHLEALLDRYRSGLARAYSETPERLRSASPPTGGWSPDQVIEHLAETERSILELLSRLLDQAGPRSDEDFDEERFSAMLDLPFVLDRSQRVRGRQPSGELDAAAAWDALAKSRRAVLKLVDDAQGVRLEDTSYPHPATGEQLNGYQWVAFLALHEGRHAEQIRASEPGSAPAGAPSTEGR